MGTAGIEPAMFLLWEIYSLLPSPLGIHTQMIRLSFLLAPRRTECKVLFVGGTIQQHPQTSLLLLRFFPLYAAGLDVHSLSFLQRRMEDLNPRLIYTRIVHSCISALPILQTGIFPVTFVSRACLGTTVF